MCEQSGVRPTWQQLEHAIKRNFGGLESEDLDPFKEFEKCIVMDHALPDLSTFPEKVVWHEPNAIVFRCIVSSGNTCILYSYTLSLIRTAPDWD